MDMWISVSIEAEEGVALPSIKRMITLWNSCIDHEHRITYRPEDGPPTIYGVEGLSLGLEDDYTAYVQYGDRWSTEGLHALAQHVTKAHAGVAVTIEEEWTGGEPIVKRERWQSGRLVAVRSSDDPMEPIDTLGRTPANALASILAAVERLGGTLEQVNPGEDFWEHFNYGEAMALSDLFESAGMNEHAARIISVCRESDPEMWRDTKNEHA